MAAPIATIVWERRPRPAKLKLEGFPRKELWPTILCESLVLLAAGCVSGELFGLDRQHLLDRALANVINYPVVNSLATAPALLSLDLSSAALALIAIPAYLAADVPGACALAD